MSYNPSDDAADELIQRLANDTEVEATDAQTSITDELRKAEVQVKQQELRDKKGDDGKDAD